MAAKIVVYIVRIEDVIFGHREKHWTNIGSIWR
jgi:hypothetical protein